MMCNEIACPCNAMNYKFLNATTSQTHNDISETSVRAVFLTVSPVSGYN